MTKHHKEGLKIVVGTIMFLSIVTQWIFFLEFSPYIKLFIEKLLLSPGYEYFGSLYSTSNFTYLFVLSTIFQLLLYFGVFILPDIKLKGE